jgi:DNA-binding GntR family transcriptional regulator
MEARWILDPGFIWARGGWMGLRPVAGPLPRRRLVDDATQALRDAILNGRLPAGARLRQTDLAAQLQISRTPIREALGRLRQEGLIGLTAGGGVRVTLLELDEAVELYDLREVLDGLAARLAARRGPAASLARLERALGRMARCLERQDPNEWFPAHLAFHDEIFRAGGNGRLRALSAVVRLSIRHFHPLLLKTPHRLEAAYREHRAIYEAIAAHDAAAAERLARAHIANAKEIVLKMMAQGDGDAAVQG